MRSILLSGFGLWRRRAIILASLTITSISAGAQAQECPGAATAKAGYVLTRGSVATEVRPTSEDFVHVTLIAANGRKQEAIYFRGLITLFRNEPPITVLTVPFSDMRSIFPLKPKAPRTLAYASVEPGKAGKMTTLELEVMGQDTLEVGSCPYSVQIIRFKFRDAAGGRLSEHTEFYSPDLGMILGRRFDEPGGRQRINKYESIKPLTKQSPT